ncbi:1-acyl-sn-glycerol-3-phosphate acyltransferase [Rubrivirga sp. S365]|uniref:1-acyl-sn-glycerol-3-phosphate acyltransferase n=1 Tax=Rubrivirga litoralis TaxID=3075598 RepID=A0ABU3BUZ8_9BACT|nr:MULTISPECIES: 1-acyl-sn-glycerol-3-phosphate acyltransferase [unclassified Rubrivirga]MDT0633121.1 1-acyl-sn-glycerol-3-phosphate acyltransferase [Rubrivirga sp. F394]MDT7855326.1 1-acyl-sn-glycerol-3-phosphate acyltransferase [Rubrivirga sp. S365]
MGPPPLYRALRAVVRALVAVFFRRVWVEGLADVPPGRGGLLVAWHPNGIVDPALMVATFPGQVVFGARHGLLRWPVLGALMRGLGTVPIYRAQDGGDPEARRAANAKSLAALADRVAAGSFAALFPEGVSHDDPHLAEVKTGAARLFFEAQAQVARDGAAAPPVIVPVGLHYDRKDAWRSDAAVAFHRPLDVRGLNSFDDPVRALTDRIEGALVDAVRPTEDWATHRLMHRAYALLRAEDDLRDGVRARRASFRERSRGFGMVWEGYHARRASHPAEVEALRRDTATYDRLLRAAGLDDADLDRAPRVASPLLAVLFVVQAVLVVLFLPPILLLGFVVNGPPFLLLNALARRLAAAQKDTATIKLLGGVVLYPLAWVVAGVLAGVGAARLHALFPALPDAPLLAGLAVFVLSAVGGALALRWGELVQETRRAVRVRRVRARRRDVVARLQNQRMDLAERFRGLADGLDLA